MEKEKQIQGSSKSANKTQSTLKRSLFKTTQLRTATCIRYIILFSVTKYQGFFLADLLDFVQLSIFNIKIELISHPEICSQVPSLSPFQNGKHFKLSSNTKNTTCTKNSLFLFSVSRYEKSTTVFFLKKCSPVHKK